MRYGWISAEDVRRLTPMAELIAAIEQAFASPPISPPRTSHTISDGRGAEGHLLLMPAWHEGGRIGIKILTVLPWLGAQGKPAIHASYVVSDARSGELLAMMDGGAITSRRTAATSALASRYLSRRDSKTLLVVGAGALANPLIEAHGAVRSLERVLVWARRPERAEVVAGAANASGVNAAVAFDLESAVRAADIVSCATASHEPLIRREWLSEGTHLDLIGAYTPRMGEVDAASVAAATVFVDDRGSARHEAGDLLKAEAAGLFHFDSIVASLTELVTGRSQGRTDDQSITLFKSVGLAREDLAAAELILKRLDSDRPST
ncbi:MAG TPA: ornithine cyclodeaminase family protein [Rhizomicrobium sp.]